MADEIFSRYELKFPMPYEVYMKLKDRLLEHLTADAYGDEEGFYSITNVYFDTYDNFFHRQNQNREPFRQKLRLRTYGVDNLDETCFLEIKKKYKGLVNKRRTTLRLRDAYRFLGMDEALLEECQSNGSGAIDTESPIIVSNKQIFKEVSFFTDFFKLTPRMVLSYDRRAFFDAVDDSVRVTFDRNIRYRTTDFRLEHGSYGECFVDSDSVLMEIKVEKSVPMWLVELLNEFGLFRKKFSKYSTCIKMGLFTNEIPMEPRFDLDCVEDKAALSH